MKADKEKPYFMYVRGKGALVGKKYPGVGNFNKKVYLFLQRTGFIFLAS